MYLTTAAMILVMITLLYVAVQPFKENSSHITTINVCCFLFLALLHTGVTGAVVASSSSEKHEQSMRVLYLVVIIVGFILPLLYISTIVLHWMCSQQKFGTELRNGYNVIP